MQQKTVTIKPKRDAGGRIVKGTVLPGAGRPPNVKSKLTVKDLLECVYQRANGQNYEEILVEDFLKARANNDQQLMLKYHQLILQKVMVTLNSVEVVDPADLVEAKKQAFLNAIAKLSESTKE